MMAVSAFKALDTGVAFLLGSLLVHQDGWWYGAAQISICDKHKGGHGNVNVGEYVNN